MIRPASLAAAIAIASALAPAAPALATSRGMPLSPSLTARGPVSHVVVGASVTTPGGSVLPAATARVDVPAGAVAIHARLVWLGSRASADDVVTLTTPDGVRTDVTADACDEVDAGASAPLLYFRCAADVTARFANALAGDVTVGDLDVSTGVPWSSAQGFAGGFALVVLFADPADTAPRVVHIEDGLLWSKNDRVATSALPPFVSASDVGRVSYVAIEGDADMPGDGECTGMLGDPSCDFTGLCVSSTCDVLFTLADERNPAGNSLNESSGDALDVDSFPIDGLLAAGEHDDLRAFVQTGGDAVLLAMTIVEVPEQDSDGDALADADEIARGTDMNDPDTDDDGIADGAEVFGHTPADPRAQPTDPLDADSDHDGLPDGVEDANGSGTRDDGETSAIDADSDADFLGDGIEVGSVYFGNACRAGASDPLVADSDGDGTIDGDEDADHDGAIDDGETSPCSFDFPNEEDDGSEPGDDPIDPPNPPPTGTTTGKVTIDPHVFGTPVVVADPTPVRRVGEEAVIEIRGELSGSTIWGCAQSSSSAPVWIVLTAFVLRRRR
jgi:hypothetical protein